VKHVGEEHALHLKQTLEENYKVTLEWDGRRYIGITLDWDYKRQQVHLSMPGYIKKALKQFKHERRKLQHQPYPSAIIKYGGKDTICHCSINITAVRQTRQEIHPTSVWQILIFGTSS
jgi:hypothetical protein